MSNGAEETFLVIDPNFHEELFGMQAHYQMKVKKLGLPEAKKAIQNITYNISGNNARVNNKRRIRGQTLKLNSTQNLLHPNFKH